jgi:nucleoid-associated protein YgaU
MGRGSSTLARIAAPAAFLLATTVLVLLVRSALEAQPVGNPEPTPATTAPAETEPRPPAEAEPGPPAEAEPEAEAETETFYTIEAGDTLESISSRYGTTVERLLELNPGIDPIALTVGQRIRVA